MKITGNKQRLCLGGWFLAGFLLAGLNAYAFISIDEKPLAGPSGTIRMLNTQLKKFDITQTAGFLAGNRIKDIRKTPPQHVEPADSKQNQSPPETQKGPKNPASKPTILPTLSGIIHVVSSQGTSHYQAVLDGRVCREKDEISNFTIDRISPAGVVIKRFGHKWVITSPDPYFSSDQGK